MRARAPAPTAPQRRRPPPRDGAAWLALLCGPGRSPTYSRRGRSSFAGPSPSREVRNPSRGSEVDRDLRAHAARHTNRLRPRAHEILVTIRHTGIHVTERLQLASYAGV